MNTTNRTLKEGSAGALIGWGMLFLSGLLGILVLEYLHPKVVIALWRINGGTSLPAGIELLLGGYRLLWGAPATALLLGLLSLRWKFPRRSWVVATWSALVISAYVFALTLTSIHFVGINASYAGGSFENRLPQSASVITSNLTAVVAYRLAENGEGRATYFQGHPIADQIDLSGLRARRVLTALEHDIEASDGRSAMCFIPRHALSVHSPVGRLDLLICFECRKLEYRVGKESDRLGIKTSSLAVFEELFGVGPNGTSLEPVE